MKLYRSVKAERNLMSTYDRLLTRWGVPLQQLDLLTRYGLTHVIACGPADRPPLVLFHGVGDDAALMWLYNAAALSEHFRLYALDTLGGPGKSRPNEAYGPAFEDALWIDDVLDALHLSRVMLAGVSNGSYIAQHYAAARPDRVERIVCISGTVAAGGKNHMGAMMRVFLPEALLPTKRNARRLIRKLCGSRFGVLAADELIMEHYRWLLRGFQNMAMRYHRIIPLTPEEIDAIRPKALYLMGECDPFGRLGGRDALIRYRMNARFLPDAGHALNHELADEVNRAVTEYLTGTGGA